MLNIESLYESLAASIAEDSKGATALVTKAEQISCPQEAIAPQTTNEELRRIFGTLGNVATIAVTEDDRPMGMINRLIFMEQYARPYSKELYGTKSCIAFMDKSPLVVDCNTPIEVLVKAAVESGGKVLADGFITTVNGEYQGVGSGFDLMKAMSDIEAEKTRQLMSSINYASLIQRSHLVESDQVLQHEIRNYGLMWQPRDVVGGDAYFFRKVADGIFGCVFDCTGHGVPGAFMTLIVMSFLEQRVHPGSVGLDPGEIIQQLNIYLKRVLRQDDRSLSDNASEDKKSNDGLDALMFVLSNDKQHLRFASAKLSMLIARPGQDDIEVLDGDKNPIGYADTMSASVWPVQHVALGPDALVMISTDGVIDQIGEAKKIAHGKRRLVQYLSENRLLDAQPLITKFDTVFKEWQGKQKRRDDVSLLAFRTPNQEHAG